MKDNTSPSARVVSVSDHSVLRYLERAKGFDFEPVRKAIKERAELALKAGSRRILLDGVELVVTHNGVVATAVPSKPPGDRGTRKTIPVEF